MIKHLIGFAFYYPQRFRSGQHYGNYQYHREQLWPTPCQHRRTRTTASLKTLKVTRTCLTCQATLPASNFENETIPF